MFWLRLDRRRSIAIVLSWTLLLVKGSCHYAYSYCSPYYIPAAMQAVQHCIYIERRYHSLGNMKWYLTSLPHFPAVGMNILDLIDSIYICVGMAQTCKSCTNS